MFIKRFFFVFELFFIFTFFFFFNQILVNSTTDISNENLFEFNLLKINDLTLPYNISVEFYSLLSKKLDYDIELVNKFSNEIVYSNSFSCSNICINEINFSQIMFTDYSLYVNVFYNGKVFSKHINFSLKPPINNLNIIFSNEYKYNDLSLMHINGSLINYGNNSRFMFKIFPKNNPDLVDKFNLNCKSKCNFDFILRKNIVFGEYEVQIYSPTQTLKKNFRIVPSGKIYETSKYKNSKNSNNIHNFVRNEEVKGLNNKINKDKNNINKNLDDKISKRPGLGFKKNSIESNKKGIVDEDKLRLEKENEKSSRRNKDLVNFSKIISLPNRVELGKEFEVNLNLKNTNLSVNDLMFSKNVEIVKQRNNMLISFFSSLLTSFGYNSDSITIKVTSIDDYISVYDKKGNFIGKYRLDIDKPEDVKDFEKNLGVKVIGLNGSLDEKTNLKLKKNDIELDFKNVDSSDIKKIEVLNKSNIKDLNSSKLVSNVIYVEANNFNRTLVKFKKKGFVENILTCSKLNVNQDKCIGNWVKTNIGFHQDNNFVWFNVSHFSAYVAEGGTYNFSINFTDLSNRLIKQQSVENLSLNLSCVGGDCGTLNVSLFYTNLDVNSNTITCVDFWDGDCSDGPAEAIDNTFDSCANGKGGDESVEHMWLSKTSAYPGDYLNITCELDPYDSGDDYKIFYYNGTTWKRIFLEENTGSSSLVNISAVFKVDNYIGMQYVRCGIDYNEDDNDDGCADQGNYYDNDDVGFEVGNLTLISTNSIDVPYYVDAQNKQYTLSGNTSKIINFLLNATGNVGDHRDLVCRVVKSDDNSIRAMSDNLYVNIRDGQNPNGTKISPVNNYNSSGRANILFNVSVHDNTALDSAELYVWDSLNNLVYKIKNPVGGADNYSSWNLTFSKSDIYAWDVLVTDSGGNQAWLDDGKFNLNISVPELNVVWLDPMQDTFKQKDRIFPMSVRIDCKNYDCGDINNSLIYLNPNVDTCDLFWNIDCSVSPDSEDDNTFDSCSTGKGNDESVKHMWLSKTSALPGDYLNITCELDPYTSKDDYKIFYYNGTAWKRIFLEENTGSSSLVNISAVFKVDNYVGMQYVRCGIDYNEDDNDDGCADQGSYYDNDDIGFNVKELVPTSTSATPFYTTSYNPSTVINLKSGESKEFSFLVNASGNIDDAKYFSVLLNGINYSFLKDNNNPIKITIKNTTEVSSCQDLDENTLYSLTSDILNYGSDCFKFNGNNIVFNGNGHIVDGDGGSTNDDAFVYKNTGDHYSNIEINDLKLTDWGRGFELYDNSYISINNISIIDSSNFGFRCRYDTEGCSNIKLNEVNIDNVGANDGVLIQDGSNITLRNLNISNVGDGGSSDTGITFRVGSYYNIILDNVNINNTDGHGIYFETFGNNVTMTNVIVNTTSSSSAVGIYFNDNISNGNLNSIIIDNAGDDGIEFNNNVINLSFTNSKILNSEDAGIRYDYFSNVILKNILIDKTTNNEGIISNGYLINSYFVNLNVKNIGGDGSDEGIYVTNVNNSLFKDINLFNIYADGISIYQNSNKNYFENIYENKIGEDGIQFENNVNNNNLNNIHLINIGTEVDSDGIHTSENTNYNNFSNIYIENCSDEGIEFYESNNNTNLINIKIINVDGNGIYFNDNGDLNSNNLFLKNLNLSTIKGEGILFQSSKNVYLENASLIDIGDSSGEDSIVITSGKNQSYYNISILNSYDSFIHSVDNSSNIIFKNMHLEKSGGYGFELYNGAVNFSLINIFISNVSDYGICFDAGTDTNNNYAYLNNISILNVESNDAIMLEKANYSKIINIFENHIGDGDGDYALYLTDSANSETINFTSFNVAEGIRVYPNSLNAKFNNIKIINNSNNMFYFNSNSGNAIINNSILKNGNGNGVEFLSSPNNYLNNISIFNVSDNMIYLSDSGNSNISNIYCNLSNSTSSYGLYINSNSKNNIVKNLFMYNLSNYGIYSSSSNNYFDNIVIEAPSNYAFKSSENNFNIRVYNAKIISSGNIGIFFDDNSSDLILKNITILKSSGSRGLVIDKDSNICILDNISILNSNAGEGFKTYCNNSDYKNILINNSYSNGFYIEDVLNSSFENILISNSGGDGLYLNNVINSSFYNISIGNSSDEQFELYYSDNNTFDSCSVLDNASSGNWNLYLGSNSENNFFKFNHFISSSKVSSNDWSLNSYWNISYVPFPLGNYWDDINCSDIFIEKYLLNEYYTCIDEDYILDSANNRIDYGPLLNNYSSFINISFVDPTPLNNTIVNDNFFINVSEEGILQHSSFIDYDYSLVGYWSGEEISGSKIIDWSSYLNNGTLNNNANILNSNKIRGNYFNFDGDDDYISILKDQSLNISKSITISAWVKWSGSGDNYQIIYYNGVWDNALRVIGSGSDQGKISFLLNISGTQEVKSNYILDNNWNHIVGVYNGSRMSIYINGNLDNYLDITGNISSSLNDNTIGSENDGAEYDFNGSIDEVMIFNRGLNENEVKSLYDSNKFRLYLNISNVDTSKDHYFSACNINQIGNFSCTELRKLNLDIGIINVNVISPLNNSRYFQNNSVFINFNSSQDLKNVSFYLNGNSSKIYYMINQTSKNWTYTLTNLLPSFYNISFMYNDSYGNNYTYNWSKFIYLKNSSQNLIKTIKSIGNNIYNVSLNISNLIFNQTVIVYDFIPINFIHYSYSIPYDENYSFIGSKYSGEYLEWNLTLVPNENILISYLINGTGNYNLQNTFMYGFK